MSSSVGSVTHDPARISQQCSVSLPRTVVGGHLLLHRPAFPLQCGFKKMYYCIPADTSPNPLTVRVAAAMEKTGWQTSAEIKIHSRLHHLEGVAHPMAQETLGSLHYMIFDLFPKGDLIDLLDGGLPPTGWQKDFLGYSIAFTLMQIRELGITLRDIKCDNILIDQDKQGFLHSKFTDFGMAIFDSEATVYQKKGVVGTWQICAPEVFQQYLLDRTFPPIGAAQDLWQLGIVLHALSGHGNYFQGNLADFKHTLKIPTFRDCSQTDFGPFSSEIRELLSLSPEKRPPVAWVAKRMADIFVRVYPKAPVTEKVRNRPKLTLDQVVEALSFVKKDITEKIASYLSASDIGLKGTLTLDEILNRLNAFRCGT